MCLAIIAIFNTFYKLELMIKHRQDLCYIYNGINKNVLMYFSNVVLKLYLETILPVVKFKLIILM